MKLILVRHGETEANKRKINQGHACNGLASSGREQAEKLARRLREEHIAAIYVSDLPRARQTAEPLLTAHQQTPVQYESRLREWSLGCFENTPYGAIQQAAADAGIPFERYKPEGGESIEDFRRRASSFYEELHERHPEETVLLITHGGFIKTLLVHLLGVPAEEHHRYVISNTGVTVLECSEPKIVLLNCTEHLGER
jgi:broad specificity phosphatase PhoE